VPSVAKWITGRQVDHRSPSGSPSAAWRSFAARRRGAGR
jgi:hypothetical protein